MNTRRPPAPAEPRGVGQGLRAGNGTQVFEPSQVFKSRSIYVNKSVFVFFFVIYVNKVGLFFPVLFLFKWTLPESG